MNLRHLIFALSLSLAAPAMAQTLKLATLAPEGSLWMRELRHAAEEIGKETEKRVSFKFYPGGVMGNDATVLRKMRLGQLQGGMLTGSELSLVYKDSQVYSLPFLFRDWADVDAVRAKVDPMLVRGFSQNGLQILAISGVGFAYLMTALPQADADSLKSAKVWVPQNDAIAQKTFAAVGLNPIPLPMADVFTSLQSGMIDTVSNTPVGAVALQWHSKVKTLVDLPLSYVVGYVALDNKAWAKLAPADQAVVLRVFGVIAGNIDRNTRNDDTAAMQAMQGQGIAVVAPKAQEVAHWRQIGQSVAEEMSASGAFSAEVLSAIDHVLNARSVASP